MTDTIAGFEFDLRQLPPQFYADPYGFYRRLREHAPVYQSPDQSWFLSRYRDCAVVYRSPAAISDKRELFRPRFGDGALYEHHTTSLVFNDDPYHSRVRGLLAAALKPAAVKAMRPALVALVERLLARAAQSGDKSVDLLAEFASAIPVEVVGNLLTVPVDEREPLRRWSLLILGALEADLSPNGLAAGNAAVEEFSAYLRSLIARRRRSGSLGETDILSLLIASHDHGDLTESELIHNCIFLLNAGHETTSNLIANGVFELLSHPVQRERLQAEPALIRSAVEEMLRFQSPNQIGNRELIQDLALRDVHLPAGSQVVLGIGAANRDPERFANPDHFDIRRQPNPHLAFATGSHTCIGMSLARLEAQIAIPMLLTKFPAMNLAGPVQWQRRARFRGLVSLPVRLQ